MVQDRVAGLAPTVETIVVPDKPHMPATAVAWLTDRLSATRCYLEFGSGGSTILAASLSVPHIISVESDPHFLAAVRDKLASLRSSSRLDLRHVEVGRLGKWGRPLSLADSRLWPDYVFPIWDDLGAEGWSPDLVLVDGRFRVATFLATLVNAAAGTCVLFDDYGDRPDDYAVVERFIAPDRMIDRSAVFTVPAEIDARAIIPVLARHCLEPI